MGSTSSSEVIIQSSAVEYAPLILILPMLAFPVILFLGKIFNGNPFWKNNVKEGGLIALVIMGASLLLSLWLIKDFIGSFTSMEEFTDWTWFTSSMWESGNTTKTVVFGFGVHVDHITVVLLFVASFLCLLINSFAIGYMNTDPYQR